MGELVDRIRNHRIWKDLEALGPVIDAAAQRENNDAATTEGIERLRAVLAFCGKRLAGVDPFLLHAKPLNNLANSIVAAQGEVAAFLADGNGTHIVAANGQADSVLAYLTNVVTLHAPEDLTFLASTAGNYQATVSNYLAEAKAAHAQVQKAASDNEAALAALAKAIAEEQAKALALTSSQQKEFADAQNTRVCTHSIAVGTFWSLSGARRDAKKANTRRPMGAHQRFAAWQNHRPGGNGKGQPAVSGSGAVDCAHGFAVARSALVLG